MKIINLQQGTLEWLAYRREHYNASDCAAMLGLSPHVSRDELLRLVAVGTDQEFNDYVQKQILEKGHEIEAKVRELIESDIGDVLYPVTACEDALSASSDGMTMSGEFAIEVKQWNNELAESVKNGIIPDSHMPQLQQNFIVFGMERIRFIVSDGTLERFVYIDVHPDAEWRDRIMRGWEQFDSDVAEFVLHEPELVVSPEPVEALPALFVRSEGQIEIKSNLTVFGERLNDYVKNLNISPKTDQEFEDTGYAIKKLEEAETALSNAESSAIALMPSIDEMRRAIGLYKDICKKYRLMLTKNMDDRKKFIRDSALLWARNEFQEFVKTLAEGIKPIVLNVSTPDFYGAIKGVKTEKSMNEKLNAAIAREKIDAKKVADEIGEKLSLYRELCSGYKFLFHDLQSIIYKPIDDFRLLCTVRIDSHKKREQERIETEKNKSIVVEQPEMVEQIPGDLFSGSKTGSTKHVIRISVENTQMFHRALCEMIVSGDAPPSLISIVNMSEFEQIISERGIKKFPGVRIE